MKPVGFAVLVINENKKMVQTEFAALVDVNNTLKCSKYCPHNQEMKQYCDGEKPKSAGRVCLLFNSDIRNGLRCKECRLNEVRS